MRFRFSIGHMFLVITGLALVLGWGHHRSRLSREMHDRMAELNRVHEIGPKFDNGMTPTPGRMDWFRETLKRRTIASVENVRTNEACAEFATLPDLKSVTITGSVTDEGFKQLASLKKLEFLCVVNAQITDEGIRALGVLDQLQTLQLVHTHVTNQGIQHISSLPNLQNLSSIARGSIKAATKNGKNSPVSF